MALYVDSAVIEDVADVASAYPVAGVTTNPSILLAAVEGGQRLSDSEVLRELLRVVNGPVFMQPVGDTRVDLYKAALAYATVDPERVVVKLPASATGLQVARDLDREGIRLAFTAVASVGQAYLGAMAGASWVIPYFCRLRRSGVDVTQVLSDISRLLTGQQSRTRILAASLKTPGDIIEASLAGAHDITAPPAAIITLAIHPLTDAAVRQFAEDWQLLTHN